MNDFAFDPVTGQPRPRSFDEVIASRLNAATPEQYQQLTRISEGLPIGAREQQQRAAEIERQRQHMAGLGGDAGQPTPPMPRAAPEMSMPDMDMAPSIPATGEVPYPSLDMLPGMVGSGDTSAPAGSAGAATPALPTDDGGLPTSGGGPAYGKPADTDRLIERLWEQDRTHAPASQPRPEQVARNAPQVVGDDAMSTELKKAMGLPYSTPDQRAQPGPPAAGAALPAVPTPATRQTGSTGRPTAGQTVETSKELNWVQQKAADWFGIDTPEERARAKTYLAHWAAGMARGKGLGAFAEANLAGMTGVREEELRQAGLDLKRDEFDMRREQTAYERTRDARRDARDAAKDAQDLQLGEYRMAEYQRAAEAERAAARDPLAQLEQIKDPLAYERAITAYLMENGVPPEEASARAREYRDIKFKVKQDPLAGLGV